MLKTLLLCLDFKLQSCKLYIWRLDLHSTRVGISYSRYISVHYKVPSSKYLSFIEDGIKCCGHDGMKIDCVWSYDWWFWIKMLCNKILMINGFRLNNFFVFLKLIFRSILFYFGWNLNVWLFCCRFWMDDSQLLRKYYHNKCDLSEFERLILK